jgi:hypothetical protein
MRPIAILWSAIAVTDGTQSTGYIGFTWSIVRTVTLRGLLIGIGDLGMLHFNDYPMMITQPRFNRHYFPEPFLWETFHYLGKAHTYIPLSRPVLL